VNVDESGRAERASGPIDDGVKRRSRRRLSRARSIRRAARAIDSRRPAGVNRPPARSAKCPPPAATRNRYTAPHPPRHPTALLPYRVHTRMLHSNGFAFISSDVLCGKR